MSLYSPISGHLAVQRGDRISLTFPQIEKILGRNLPASARSHPAWWANNPTGHSHCRAWYDAGWRTENLNLGRGTVDFVRRGRPVSQPGLAEAASPFGALAGTVVVHDPAAVTAPSDERWTAERGEF